MPTEPGQIVVGLGPGETLVSTRDRRPDAATTCHIESYTCWDLSMIRIVAGDVKHLTNANLVSSVKSIGREVTVYGLFRTFLV